MSHIEPLLKLAEDLAIRDSTASPSSLPTRAAIVLEQDSRQIVVEDEVVRLYEKNAAALVRYGLAICGDLEMAQDAVQEAFLRYYVALRKETAGLEAKGWLYSTTRNYILDRLKEYYVRNGRSLEEASHVTEDQNNPETWTILNEISDQVEKVLTPRELQCLRLRNEGLRYQDIADTLGIDSGTVGAFLTRALKKIRAAFAPQEKAK